MPFLDGTSWLGPGSTVLHCCCCSAWGGLAKHVCSSRGESSSRGGPDGSALGPRIVLLAAAGISSRSCFAGIWPIWPTTGCSSAGPCIMATCIPQVTMADPADTLVASCRPFIWLGNFAALRQQPGRSNSGWLLCTVIHKG